MVIFAFRIPGLYTCQQVPCSPKRIPASQPHGPGDVTNSHVPRLRQPRATQRVTQHFPSSRVDLQLRAAQGHQGALQRHLERAMAMARRLGAGSVFGSGPSRAESMVFCCERSCAGVSLRRTNQTLHVCHMPTLTRRQRSCGRHWTYVIRQPKFDDANYEASRMRKESCVLTIN